MTTKGYQVTKRKKGGKELGPWQLRIYVPEEFQHREGRKDIWISLRTSDEALAHRRAIEEVAKVYRRWEGRDEIVAPRQPTLAELESIAIRYGHDAVLDYEANRRELLRGRGIKGWRRDRRRAEINRETAAFLATDGDLSIAGEFAEIAVEELGLDLGEPERSRLAQLINKARVEALTVAAKHAEGELEAESDGPMARRVRSAAALQAKPGETIVELFEIYAEQLLQEQSKQPAGVDQDRMVIGQFAEFVGKERAVASLTFDEIKEFVDALAAVPAGYKKRKAFNGCTIRQAIEKGQREGVRTLSPVTQERYISAVSAFYAWLKKDRGGRRVTSNPFDGLHLDVRKLKRGNTRPPFTADQITAIINSPLFTGFLADGKEHRPGNMRADDWRYWVPLICLFTGARIGEAAQLHVDDIFQIGGIWCAEFRTDAETGQRTKNEKSRIVALHSKLLKIGLREFVERERERAECDGNRQLFPDLEPGPRGQFGDKPSRWFRSYLDKIGVKARDAADGFGSHSFRHTMADQLRAAGHLDDVFDPLIHGHYNGGTTGLYGRSQQGTPELSSRLIESVAFVPIAKGRAVEGGKPVDFSHLFI